MCRARRELVVARSAGRWDDTAGYAVVCSPLQWEHAILGVVYSLIAAIDVSSKAGTIMWIRMTRSKSSRR